MSAHAHPIRVLIDLQADTWVMGHSALVAVWAALSFAAETIATAASVVHSLRRVDHAGR